LARDGGARQNSDLPGARLFAEDLAHASMADELECLRSVDDDLRRRQHFAESSRDLAERLRWDHDDDALGDRDAVLEVRARADASVEGEPRDRVLVRVTLADLS